MSDRISDERLSEIREEWCSSATPGEVSKVIDALLGEVDALQAELEAGLAREQGLREAAQRVETMLSAGYTLPNSGLTHDLAELRAALAALSTKEEG